jgi:DNA-binding transcriptional regulator YhcF (GntR family)
MDKTVQVNDRLVSPREFAERMNLKPSTVYQLYQLGKLEGFQIVKRGSIRIWLNASIDKLLQAPRASESAPHNTQSIQSANQ